MRLVEPRVYLIAETKLDRQELKGALGEVGGEIATGWFDRVDKVSKSEGELLTEVAGRICYKSYGVGLNPNVKKIREDSGDYINNTLGKGDGSIFEHAVMTFLFANVSRVFTHELVRHRVGVAISQESLRYVRPTNVGLWIPPGMEDDKEGMVKAVEAIEENYKNLETKHDWDGMNFDEKKAKTSAFRRILPDGMATNIVWSVNHRELRHVITMRTAEGAEVEIRFVFDKVAKIVKKKFPLIYNDFEAIPGPNGISTWKPKFVKA